MSLQVNQLTGFGVQADPPAVSALALHDTVVDTGSSSVDLILPAHEAGDLIVVFDRRFVPDNSEQLTPAPGFTTAVSLHEVGEPVNVICSYKVADGTDTVYPFEYGSSGRRAALVFRPTGEIAAVSVLDVAAEQTDGDPVAQLVECSASTQPLIVLAWYISNTSIDGARTFSPVEDNEYTVGPFWFAKYRIYNSSPANTSVDMVDEGDGQKLMSFYLEVS